MDMEIPELVPMDDYDARQARLESSMRWLLSKAYGGSIPLDYQESFFSLGLSSVLACRLTSSELYWTATCAIFPEVKGQTQQGHAPLIQFLVRHGVYLADVNGVEINEKLLQRTSPIHLMAHITLLEGLMTAYINSTLTPEKVVPAVRKFASFSASSELPTNAEEAAMFWVNKTCASLCRHLTELDPSVCPESLTMNDIKDVNDGRCLAAVIGFYCPQELPLSAVELGDSLAIADSLYNLQLLHNFCRSHLNASLLTLTVMDLFYTPDTLHLSILAFYADLFHCLEVERASCVRDTGLPLNLGAGAAEPKLQKPHVLSSPPVSQVVIPQISDPTKRSFLHSVSTSHSRPQSSSVNGTRQPLLPRRHSESRSTGGSNSNTNQPPTEAWVPNSGIPASTSKGSAIVNASSGKSLLSNVMIDDSIDLNSLDSSCQSCDDEVGSLLQTLNKKISSKAVDRKRRFDAPSTIGPLQCSVDGGQLRNFASSNLPSDPLLPAQLRPSKEKLSSHSKKCEYNEKGGGGGGDQKKHEAAAADDSDCERPEFQREASRSSSSSSTPIDEYKTPSVESVENNGTETGGKEIVPENNGFTSSEIEPGNENDSMQLRRSRLGGQSYVVRGRPTVLDDALAAGLPVVTSGGSLGIPVGFMSVSGRATDGGFDQELHKLQVDSRDKEFSGRNGSRGCFVSLGADGVQLHGGAKKPPDKGVAENGSKTSFAQIKKQKEAKEISKGSRDLGSIPEGSAGNHPAGVPLLACPRKKTTFGALPNQTTWVQESAQRVSEKAAASTGEDTAEPMPSELIGLRLKLEENRRLIESRKRLTERQWHQQRQQMGKEAFIQVITKNKNGVDLPCDEKPSATTEASSSVLRKVPVKSEERKTKAGTLPGRQSPNLKIIHEPDVVSHDDLNETVAQSSNDPAESLPKVDTENQALVVDSNSSLQVIGSTSKEAVSEESSVSEVGAESLPHRSAGADEQTPYDASLDRINSSLTELQGEIQRLSRQQDQINSLVRSEVGQGTRSVNASAREPQGREVLHTPQSSRGTTTTPTKDEFPVLQFPSARKAAPSVMGVGPLPMGAKNFLCTEIALHESRPSTAPYSVPSYPSVGMPFPPRYHPTPSVPLSTSDYQPYAAVPSVTMPAERMYSPLEPGHQYVAIGSQFHPSSGVYPVVPGMYPISVPTSYSHYQGSVHQQYPHLQNLSTLMRHPEFPPGLPPHEMPFPEFMQPLPHTSPLSFQSPASWAGSQLIQGVATETQNPYMQVQAADVVTAGQDFGLSEGSDTWKIPGSAHPPPSVQDLGDAGQTDVHPQAGGFFVDLRDSPTPTRQKPNLKARHKSKPKGNGCDVLVLDPVMSVSASPVVAEPPMYPSDPASEDVTSDAKAMPGNSETSPLVFVIGQSTENEDDWLEMEKRKQRLCEMQIKRQEEQELRREKLQREQERKREQQRMKQELTEQKRAEEKARREAIFQSYLQKKKEKEMSEESPAKSVPPVIRRQRSAQQRGARPKSQPALPAEMTPTKAVPGIIGHSSHDNLATDGIIAKMPASNYLRSNEKVISAPNEVPLAFGGLTHRRPPTPDQNTPTGAQPTSDGSESSGSQMADNYTGPKLFVKPSQKSNRHIIINAISHCCLAGSVNKDVKDKVLEEIARSEAKHFIILFRDAAMQYRGLYTYNPEQEEVLRIHGVGPKQLTDKVMEKFYKYNSGSKKFSEITSTKHLTATIDAITVLSTVWQKTRPAAPSKKPL